MLPIPILLKVCGEADISILDTNLISKYVYQSFDKYKEYYLNHMSLADKYLMLLSACYVNNNDYINKLLPMVDIKLINADALKYVISKDNYVALRMFIDDGRFNFTVNNLLWVKTDKMLKLLLDTNQYTIDDVYENMQFCPNIASNSVLIESIKYISSLKRSSKTTSILNMSLTNMAKNNKRKVVKYMLDNIKFTYPNVRNTIESMISNINYDKYMSYINISNFDDKYADIFCILVDYITKFNRFHVNIYIMKIMKNLQKIRGIHIKMLKCLVDIKTDSLSNTVMNEYLYKCICNLSNFDIYKSSLVKVFVNSINLIKIEGRVLEVALKTDIKSVELIYSSEKSHYYIDDSVIDKLEERGLNELVSTLAQNPNIKLKKKRRLKKRREDISDPEFLNIVKNEIMHRTKKKFRY